jgi:hypothetical protein
VNPCHRLQPCRNWWFGSDKGEWGGELVFENQLGVRRLSSDNVRGILRVGRGIVVFTGLAHLGGNHGEISEVAETPAGLTVRRIHKLIGVPKDIIQQEDGGVRFAAFTGNYVGSVMEYRCFELFRDWRLRGIICSGSSGLASNW